MRDWSKRDLSLSATQMKQVMAFGPIVELDGTITVPCACEMNDGFITERALLRFTDYPPKTKRTYIRFADEIKTLFASS
jgi:hypothetical protein